MHLLVERLALPDQLGALSAGQVAADQDSSISRSVLRGEHWIAMPDKCVRVMPASWSIRASTSSRRSLAPLLHEPQLQHFGLCLDAISVRLTARRLPLLARQVSRL